MCSSPPRKGTGMGWRKLSLITSLHSQWAPLHIALLVLPIKPFFLSSLVNLLSSLGAVIMRWSKMTVPEEDTHSAFKMSGVL